jgi:Pyruvate/2-oxoacid:ferredoxin oxidoreductase gamma subunit
VIPGASYNIIVAGLGGQGVNTLSRALFELAAAHEYPCQGAIFKGGAQKAGTIHAEIRIFDATCVDHARRSNQILPGTLDLMLGLEPHEAARFAGFFGERTRLIVNTAAVPFYSERLTGQRPPDPIEALRRSWPDIIARDFVAQAKRDYGDRRVAHRLMLLAAAETDGFPFARDAIHRALGAASPSLDGDHAEIEGR